MIKELSPLEACRIIKEHDFPLMITTLPPIPATMDGKTEKDLWNVIETALKALEIIKEKRVDISFLFNVCYCSNMGGANLYNEHRKNKELHLTQEEYNLLKEVLL